MIRRNDVIIVCSFKGLQLIKIEYQKNGVFLSHKCSCYDILFLSAKIS